MFDKTNNNGFNVKNLMMNDEAHFELTGAANGQNCHYCTPSGDNPKIIREKPWHDPAHDCMGRCYRLGDSCTYLLQ